MKAGKRKLVLVVSLGHMPSFGGSYRVLHELMTRVGDENVVLLTCKDRRTSLFDKTVTYHLHRTAFVSILNPDSMFSGRLSMDGLYRLMCFWPVQKLFQYLVFPLVSLLYLAQYILRKKVTQIVFVQSVFPFAWYIIFLKRLTNLNVKTFVYGEDVVSYRAKTKLFGLLNRTYVKGLRDADSIVANSLATMGELKSCKISQAKITVVYPSVDYETFVPLDKGEAKRKFGVEDRYVLLSVGRLIRRKGFDKLLDVLPSVRTDIPNVKYVICGNGYDGEYLKSKATALKLDNIVTFVHGVPFESLPALYSAADLFVMPNRLDEKDHEQEGFGIVFLEANACGIPVIGGRSGGVKEIIEDGVNGFIVDGNNSDELRDRILDIYSRPEDFPPDNIRRFVMERYTWDRSASVFNSLLIQS
ncbi:MAG: glycosyltransferase family 4 protein [Bacteroidetes bacterium]|nr:glycosyltransferase family 4 protein [Bacteroidota bacterium]